MKPKTRNCENCSLADFRGDVLICTKGHKPRFYLPQGNYPHFQNNWGYKRRCEDFEEGSAKGIVREFIDLNKIF